MEKLKPEDIKYSYCWHCVHYTAMCPHCNGNACSCGCALERQGEYKDTPRDQLPCMLSGFWEAEKKAYEMGIAPADADETAINEWFEFKRKYFATLTPEQKEKNQGWNGGYLSDVDYWYVENAAKKIGMAITSLEDLAKEFDLTVTYDDLKTGKEYQEESPGVLILEHNGWESMEAFETEKIPWPVYCERRENSVYDDSKHKERAAEWQAKRKK